MMKKVVLIDPGGCRDVACKQIHCPPATTHIFYTHTHTYCISPGLGVYRCSSVSNVKLGHWLQSRLSAWWSAVISVFLCLPQQ